MKNTNQKNKQRKYVIEEELYNNRRIQTFDSIEEWQKEIDEIAVNSINKGTFKIMVFEFENEENEIETKNVKIFGRQGKRDRTAYVDIIPQEWGEPIFIQEIEYFEILENEETGRYYISTDYDVEEYDTKEECINNESPSQYIPF